MATKREAVPSELEELVAYTFIGVWKDDKLVGAFQTYKEAGDAAGITSSAAFAHLGSQTTTVAGFRFSEVPVFLRTKLPGKKQRVRRG